MLPVRFTNDGLKSEIRCLIEAAKNLPADGISYSSGDVKMRHDAKTSMTVERVFVQRYGKLWRSSFDGKKWRRIDEVGGSI